MQSGALRCPVRLAPSAGLALGRLGVARSYPRTLAEYPELTAHIVALPHRLPGATALSETLHTLPTHSRADRDDIDQLIAHLIALR
mgnify:CR=1 FL=1